MTTDLRNAPSLVVTEEEVVYEQDGWLHTVEVASQNRKHTYYPKKWLKVGSQYTKIDHAIDEFSSQGSSITSQRLGWLELEANLGSGEKKVERWLKDGQEHCDTGPSKVEWYSNGKKKLEQWAKNGILHCESGPACVQFLEIKDEIEGSNNIKEEYYIDGIKVPKFMLFKYTLNKFDVSDCAICLLHLDPNDKVLFIPCGHIFHMECLLKTKDKCPNCRMSLEFS